MKLQYIKFFEEIDLNDIALVGGKNASLGYMITHLSTLGITVPHGFAITADAYWHYLNHNALTEKLRQCLHNIDPETVHHVGHTARTLVLSGAIPDDLAREIINAYHLLSQRYGEQESMVAVRSSATAEDLPTASFAGQQDTFLGVAGIDHLLDSVRRCIASLFTDRAITYREQKQFDHFKVALSVGVQKMIRADLASAGVAFSLDTESGFKDVVMIESSYGLGESVVQGTITPDLFLVHKPTLACGYAPIIKKQLGVKKTAIVYGPDYSVITTPVPPEKQLKFSIPDDTILNIARAVITIENAYSQQAEKWTPMDIEWATDGIDNKLYIIQARPETIHGAIRDAQDKAHKKHAYIATIYSLTNTQTNSTQTDMGISHKRTIIATGQSIGARITSGTARIIAEYNPAITIQQNDIIITEMTNPDWLPLMKQARGIITEYGGRTCHAAIVSRELEIPAIVGVQNACTCIQDGQEITLDCSQGSQGYIYAGRIPYTTHTYTLDTVPQIISPKTSKSVDLLITIADPDKAFTASSLPTSGVGLARIEFIIAHAIQVHPLALLHPERITDHKTQTAIEKITAAYTDKKQFYIEALGRSIGLIAAAFYPRQVLVRFSDFKTSEYRDLIGGSYFEPREDNPMLGLRGAARYANPDYQEIFQLECEAINLVRTVMGLTNVAVMVPFVRSIGEAKSTLALMKKQGLTRNTNNNNYRNSLRIYMMVEIPSNILMLEQYCSLFDGFSIGSNDLTQLVLGVDRDSSLVAPLFNEQDQSVLTMLSWAIEKAHRANKPIGICGQGPSDYPKLATFLINHGIDSLSLNSDTIIPFLVRTQKENTQLSP